MNSKLGRPRKDLRFDGRVTLCTDELRIIRVALREYLKRDLPVKEEMLGVMTYLRLSDKQHYDGREQGKKVRYNPPDIKDNRIRPSKIIRQSE